MATADSAKEEIGWLKVVFAVAAATDVSLLAWVSQTYGTAAGHLILAAIAAALALTVSVIWINRLAYRKIHELENLR
jgi:hypothetical protein